jgi:uracil phosphoribosyltransferase
VLHRISQRSAIDFSLENQFVETLRSHLPTAIRGHVIRAVEKPGELVIFVDSAAWAARMRLLLVQDPDLARGRTAIVKVLPQGGIGR